MKVRLFCSDTSGTATSMVISQLGKNNTTDSSHIYIAPDRFTLSVEQEIFQQLALPGTSNIDVVSFTRLAIRELKHLVPHCLTKEGGVLVLKKVIDQNRDSLIHYSKGSRSMSFANEMFAVIASIRNNGYTTDDLESVLPILSRSTKTKMTDIILLYREYIKELGNYFDDSTTRIDKLILAIKDSEWIKNSHIYLSGFTTFSGKQMAVLQELIKHSQSVNIAITPTNHGGNADLFPSETLTRITALTTDLGIVPEEYKKLSQLSPPFDTIHKELFAYSGKSADNSQNKVILYKENTVYDEINGIAREICRLVRREHYRYKDIAIINCNTSNNDIIAPILTRYNIPYFVDTKYPLQSTITAKYIIALLEVIAYNFRQDKVLNLVKNQLFHDNIDDICMFENFVLAYGVNYQDFLLPFHVGEHAKTCEVIRQKLTTILNIDGKLKTYQQYAEWCQGVLNHPYLEQRLNELLQNIKESMLAESNAKSVSRLNDLLTEIKQLFSQTEIDIVQFIDTLKSSIEAIEISLIPQFIDSVFIGNLKDSRYNDLKTIFIMSASDGFLPTQHRYKSIISPMDESMLEESGIYLYPNQQDLMREEEFLLLDLFTKVKEKIYIGYSCAQPNGTATPPAEVVNELKHILQASTISFSERYSLIKADSYDALIDSMASKDNSVFQYLYWVNKNYDNSRELALSLDSIYASMDAITKSKINALLDIQEQPYAPCANLYFKVGEKGEYLTSISQLETYFACPYRHHAERGLKLKERESAELHVIDIGNIIHKVLELYFRTTMGKIDALSQEDLEIIAHQSITKAFEEEVSQHYSVDMINKTIIERLKIECEKMLNDLTANVKNSLFKPYKIEYGFGWKTGAPAITIDMGEHKFLFRGKIDRVDMYDNQVVVIDYKTGSNMKEAIKYVYTGQKIQAYMYLNALSAMGYDAVGAFYLPINQKYAKDGVNYQMKGQMITEMSVINQLDITLNAKLEQQDKVQSSIIPIRLASSKNGIRITTPRNKIEKAQFYGYLDYTTQVLKVALAEILSGHIAKASIDDGCKYCAYKEICKSSATERVFMNGKIPPRQELECE